MISIIPKIPSYQSKYLASKQNDEDVKTKRVEGSES